MDRQEGAELVAADARAESAPPRRTLTRRDVIKYGAAGAVGIAGAGCLVRWLLDNTAASAAPVAAAGPFRGDAPPGRLWEAWNKRGWVREARHYLKLGRNVRCGLCPNRCLLAPGDRGRCRNRVNKDGTLYTLVYGNPCSFHADPVEKKPLFHFHPGERTFSIATSGCGFRCLNCQNWDISQRKPEETRAPRKAELRLRPGGHSSVPREVPYVLDHVRHGLGRLLWAGSC